ncbi:MAG: MATE family efflux transporter, partial [Clostridiaceae bacterium]|nr:MATE family efflux transporter [Clostridiaceae bacterium]
MEENTAEVHESWPAGENKMGVMPVSRLIITMSLPAMLSMLVQALYSLVDSMYVSRISENAFAALSMAYPAQHLMIAVMVGTGVGINALLSRSLGEKNQERADRAAGTGMFLAVVNSVLFAVLGILLSRFYFETQTDIGEITELGTEYLRIVTVCSFGMAAQVTFERLLQSTGKMFLSMITQSLGAVLNMILDPILIFGWFGLPAMGVRGAAIATVISQCTAAVLALIFNIAMNRDIKLKIREIRPRAEIIRRILAVGIPTAVMMSIGSAMIYGLNRILITFTPAAIAVFGAYFRLEHFVFMPVFGLTTSLVPIIAYNYGAGRKSRVLQAIKLSILYATAVMIIGFTPFQVIPAQLLWLFNPSAAMLEIGVPAFRIISISFIFAGFCVVSGSVFQALGSGLPGMLESLARQLIVLLPLAYVLSARGGLGAVWWAYPLAEIVSVVMSIGFMRYFY